MSKNKPLTKDVMDQVVSMRKRNIFVKDIAKELDICMASVYKAIHLSNNFNLLRGSRKTFKSGKTSQVDAKLIERRTKPNTKLKKCGYKMGSEKCQTDIPCTDIGCRTHYHMMVDDGKEPAIEDVGCNYTEQRPKAIW